MENVCLNRCHPSDGQSNQCIPKGACDEPFPFSARDKLRIEVNRFGWTSQSILVMRRNHDLFGRSTNELRF